MNLGNNISDTLDIYVVRHSGWWKVRDKIYWEVLTAYENPTKSKEIG